MSPREVNHYRMSLVFPYIELRLAGIVDKKLENTSLDKTIEANSDVNITGSAFIVPETLPV